MPKKVDNSSDCGPIEDLDLMTEVSVAKPAEPPVDLSATIRGVIDGWFYTHIHGSAVSRSTEAVNHLRKSLEPLAAALVAALGHRE